MNTNKLHPAKPSTPSEARKLPRTRTGIKAGDIYMQYPRGSNN